MGHFPQAFRFFTYFLQQSDFIDLSCVTYPNICFSCQTRGYCRAEITSSDFCLFPALKVVDSVVDTETAAGLRHDRTDAGQVVAILRVGEVVDRESVAVPGVRTVEVPLGVETENGVAARGCFEHIPVSYTHLTLPTPPYV